MAKTRRKNADYFSSTAFYPHQPEDCLPALRRAAHNVRLNATCMTCDKHTQQQQQQQQHVHNDGLTNLILRFWRTYNKSRTRS